MRHGPVAQAQNLRKREAKDKMVALVAGGMAINPALAIVGRRRSTYERWRLEDKDFSRKITALRLRNRDVGLPGMDFVTFRDTYFDRPTAAHHYRMIEAIERAAPDSITMVLAFPEAAKTSLFTDRICYLLGPVDPNHRICVISEGQDLSRKIVHHVASRMTDEQQFAAYIGSFGPFKAPDRASQKQWNADILQVLLSRNDEKEFSVEAKGWGSKLYGGRYTWVWLDDLQSSESLNQTPQILRYLRQTVLTRPAKGEGKSLYTGSRVGIGDVPSMMIDEGMVDTLVQIPALTEWLDRDQHFWVDRDNKVHLVEGCPEISTWPEHWSMLQFAQRRKIVGEEIWARTYMQQQVVAAGAAFTEAMIESVKDRTRGNGRANVGTDVILSVDPAFDSGVCAFVACAYAANKLWVLEVLERPDIHRYEDIYEQLGLWAMRYRPSVVILEQNNFQRGMHQDDRMLALSRRFGFEIHSHQTSRNKNDPVIGVKMMASAFIDGELSIPWGTDEAIATSGRLCDELRDWRPKSKHIAQDLVMALWFCWLYWEAQRQDMGLVLPSQQVPSWAKSNAAVPSWVGRSA